MTRTAAASLAAVSVLLSLATTSCAGRTHLRGSVTATESVEERIENGGNRLRGSVTTLDTAAAEKRRGSSSGRKLRSERGNGQTRRSRKLQASSSPGDDNGPASPDCASLFVPTNAGALTGESLHFDSASEICRGVKRFVDVHVPFVRLTISSIHVPMKRYVVYSRMSSRQKSRCTSHEAVICVVCTRY